MEVLGQPDQRLHDALHVYDHGFHGSGQDGKLLMQEIAGRWNTLAHQYLIGRAANSRQIHALGACLPRIFDNLRIL